tara:strand:- start:4511 stop:4792 length:282 start_codon:yes stop_codon:yes gene_type:complete
MNIGEAKKRLNAYLLDSGLDPDTPTYRAFTILCLGYDALQEQVNNLEDIDEVAGKYRDLAEEAIDELCSTEDQAAINYGYADRLRNKFEEIAK